MRITVHHLENSRSQRVLWLLEELGMPYEVRHYERNKKTMLAPPGCAGFIQARPAYRIALAKGGPYVYA